MTTAAMQTNNTLLHNVPEIAFDDWLALFRGAWVQGEHVAIIGMTGTGKTTVASKAMDIREYVAVFAVKRHDETLEQFKKNGYTVITKWPPDFGNKRVILWIKPKSIAIKDVREQAHKVHAALNKMYLSGGWCIFLDDGGYIAGVLGLSSAVGILLNQGRSSGISVVLATTRPSSVVSRIPREALTQVRHHLIFKFTDVKEMESCASIAGISSGTMKMLQARLRMDATHGHSDFLYIGKTHLFIVRNT